MVEYSGKIIRSMPGKPVLTPLTISQIFLAFSVTSSLVWSRGIGYWKTQTPTVSGELEISPCRDMMQVYLNWERENWDCEVFWQDYIARMNWASILRWEEGEAKSCKSSGIAHSFLRNEILKSSVISSFFQGSCWPTCNDFRHRLK